ncbi:alpha-ketoglutarate-dependent dioxygenase alkB 6 [Mayamaea pseudoterrestris]|nr:alpha-ketoglutarate-dependent dioxygenase alkB 6 [Mayamaea pseudoterrestris]
MDVEAIDFKKLLREERRKARLELQQQAKAKQVSEASAATSQQNLNNIQIDPLQKTLPPWNHGSIPPLPVLDDVEHCILRDPPLIHYVADFLPLSYQEQLVHWLLQLPYAPFNAAASSNTTNERNAVNRWTTLQHAKRRVALFTRTADTSFPEPLEELANALEMAIFNDATNTLRFNHVLVNEYQANQGILAHTDGPAYESLTATLSIGSSVLLQLQSRQHDDTTMSRYAVLLQGGSLVVFRDGIYKDYLHSIAQNVEEEVADAASNCLNVPGNETKTIQRGFRISLTFRCKR